MNAKEANAWRNANKAAFYEHAENGSHSLQNTESLM